ncbi:MAG TPA: AIM24 family protein [Anaerolineaceae bacterium]|nr:AIM24 family protein [Anaerolineaceae bacterium]HPN51941.1 AIM24 family protein [Anaerolineaceae bacterium]
MGRYSVQEFLQSTAQNDAANSPFEIESPHMLEINLNGLAWMKAGSMVGYTGQVKFTREGIMEHGVDKMFKKMLTGEGTSLMKAEGRGRVYLADHGKKICVLNLQNESIYVNGHDLLALEPSIQWDITLMKRVAGMLSGGLFNMRLSGTGMVAITTYYEPLTLRVTPEQPVFTDPNATVAWSGNLQPDLKTDISLGTLLGRGSGESIQMKFAGQGWVVIQPFEEVYYVQGG